MKESNHDYQSKLKINMKGVKEFNEFFSWEDFKEYYNNIYNDTYNFVFRWDIDKDEGLYTLKLHIMLQAECCINRTFIYSITQEQLDDEVKAWLHDRKKYIEKIWLID